MRVVLRRRLRDPRSVDRFRYRQTVFEVERVSIGRGADQLIQIPDARVSVAHAVIELRKKRLWLRVLGAPIPVNGEARRQTPLRGGDVLTLGGRHLTVEDVRHDGVVVLRLGLPVDGGPDQSVTPDPQTLREAGLRAVRSSWTLVLAVLTLTLLAPLLVSWDTPLRTPLRAAALVPGDRLWLPGPLHSAHQSIGGDCNACHGAPFERVANGACIRCHPGTQHHVPAASPVRASFAAMQCADCHEEHAEPSRLLDTSGRACVVCHGRLHRLDAKTTLQDATDFGTDHPDFSLAMLEPPAAGAGANTEWRTRFSPGGFRPRPEEHSNLKFSHEVHLDRRGIKSGTGDRVLECTDCHQTDPGGRHMVPVRMERDCAGCHSLLYDENDPGSAVPHGALAPVFTALKEHFSRMFLESGRSGAALRRRPGGEQAVLTQDTQRLALDWTTQQALRAAKELLEKRVCVECHTVSVLPGKGGFDQWRVEPVKLSPSWMPRAEFDHAAHRSSTCLTCHAHADTSRASGDVLMPGIAQCRTCHGGGGDHARLASDCGMCHKLHVPGRGDFVAAAR
jgi:hypothetical protein